jgi:hypothetical protein
MPYADPKKRAAYKREWTRKRWEKQKAENAAKKEAEAEKSPPKKPRASKTKVSWIKKQPKDQRAKTRRRAWIPKMKEYTPSDHPMVQMLKEHEGNGDNEQALIAGFQNTHCTPEKFQADREIARLRLSDGRIKKMYACDVCGFVGHKVTAT